jgi:deoxyribodipyrimidine photo-lyase
VDTPILVWFRQDLRLADNPALQAALKLGGPILPVFIWAPEEEGRWAPASASRYWLHQSLKALDAELERRGSRLILLPGPTAEALEGLAKKTGAGTMVWNRRYEPAVIRRDTALKSKLKAAGLTVESFNAALLWEPWTVATQTGKPYQVFTPFWKACLQKAGPPPPTPAPARLPAPSSWPRSVSLEKFALEPNIDWASDIRAAWQPGEAGANVQLERFLTKALGAYEEDRNRPDLSGTSRLSPHLHFGEIGPAQVWHAVREHTESGAQALKKAGEWYLREIVWRDFAHHLVYHFPHTPDEPLRSEFADFPWQNDAKALKAWQKGRTGHPIVDAGMRELWSTGWMHNRVRMVVASFLVKHLLIPWQRGAEWFWDTLVDADLANNTLGWQWTAGCGADAAPFFRIFNPVNQGEKFDTGGCYVRRWVPELTKLPNKWLHQPWSAPSEVLENAGVVLGKTYPQPIVDHAESRRRALDAFAQIKQ